MPALEAGLATGNTTRKNTPKREQPSIRAASSSSLGNDWKNEVIR
ncbi:hypothetical protein H4W80_002157 [Nonomuraea angiospora]|uniref:Uncharacterized protein n=1 Tax=Nonomuraea angiospora TaxID=46172 RepID=A0ABR9LTA9_9ACTN|nr:hypothetical protein [Nonomuraea angiospora]